MKILWTSDFCLMGYNHENTKYYVFCEVINKNNIIIKCINWCNGCTPNIRKNKFKKKAPSEGRHMKWKLMTFIALASVIIKLRIFKII